MKQRLITFLAFVIPCAVLFVVHYNALRGWFFMDDFAWLGLRLELNQPSDLIDILFGPRAQGTVRTLSERLFFLVFSIVFGMKAGPFHYWVFLTQCGSLALANLIVRRLSGSALAGFAAATAWAVTHSVAVSLSWLSSYNEILCGFCMLSAFYCLIRFVEHGEQRLWIWQWVPYLTGFLALEVTVVYPAVAFVYVWLSARQYWKKTLWLWVPSLLFTAIHFLVIPKSPTPPYKMIFDLGMLRSLWRYAFKAVGPSDILQFTVDMPGPIGWWLAVLIMALLAVFLGMSMVKREWMPLIGLAWFVLLLCPVLPLQNHFSDYYSTIASFGVAMLMGWAFERAFNTGWVLRTVAVSIAGLYIWCEAVEANSMEKWYRLHSGQMHMVLHGIEETAQRRPIETVMLAGIDDELYISGLLDNPFRLYGIQQAYLMPGTEALIRSVPRDQITMRTDQDMADRLIADPKTVVLAFDGRGVVDVTEIYRAMQGGAVRLTVVRTADPISSGRLGSGWNEVENGFRWMQRRATVTLDMPSNKLARVVVELFCPQSLLDQAAGKLELRAFAGGKPIGTRKVAEGKQHIEFETLPAELFANKQVEIALEVSHVVVPPGDGRELGVAVFEVGAKAP